MQSKKNLMYMYAGKVVYSGHVEREECDTTEMVGKVMEYNWLGIFETCSKA